MSKDKQLGNNIRKLRLDRGMTLKDLADKTELSTSYLSMVERGLCSIYVSALQRISEALGVSQADLTIAESDTKKGLVRFYERPSIKLEGSTMIYNYLVDDSFIPRLFEPIKVAILPSQNIVHTVPYSHSGEEFVYVLQGILTLKVDNHTYSLSEGESAHFCSSIQHEWLNYTDKIVTILSIHSDPHAEYFGKPTA